VLLERQLIGFAANEGLTVLKQLDVDTVSRFRTGWKDGPLAASKKLERLRTFLRFCQTRGWIDSNPAKELRSPKLKNAPTLPFSREQMMAIVNTATQRVLTASAGSNKARQLRALVLFLRYTGLRISDAVGCSVDKLLDGKIWLNTAKTAQHVYCPLPPFVTKELEALPGPARGIGSGRRTGPWRPRARSGVKHSPACSKGPISRARIRICFATLLLANYCWMELRSRTLPHSLDTPTFA
jgi:integrase